jgi:hypothetical protein
MPACSGASWEKFATTKSVVGHWKRAEDLPPSHEVACWQETTTATQSGLLVPSRFDPGLALANRRRKAECLQPSSYEDVRKQKSKKEEAGFWFTGNGLLGGGATWDPQTAGGAVWALDSPCLQFLQAN